jgi:hypothetical protein
MFGTPKQVFTTSHHIPLPDSGRRLSFTALEQMLADLMALGISGGPALSVSRQGINATPYVPERLFVMIDDNNGEGGHAWTEANLVFPPTPKRLAAGRRGTLALVGGSGSSGSSGGGSDSIDAQVAWSFNGNNYDPDAVVEIVRVAATHYAIVEGCCTSETGSPAPICVDCDGDGIFETCFERKANGVWGPVDSDPAPPASPPPTDAERKQCYVDCLAAGGTSAECAAKCGVVVTPDPTGGGAGGGGGGGLGGGGFGGGP